MTKQEQEDLVKKFFEPIICNAIRNMKMTKILYLTKDGKFYSNIVATEKNKIF